MVTKNFQQVLTYLTPAQKEALDLLNKKTGVPRAELLREAVDLLLAHYGEYHFERARATEGTPRTTSTALPRKKR